MEVSNLKPVERRTWSWGSEVISVDRAYRLAFPVGERMPKLLVTIVHPDPLDRDGRSSRLRPGVLHMAHIPYSFAMEVVVLFLPGQAT